VGGNGGDNALIMAAGKLLSMNTSMLRINIDGKEESQALLGNIDPFLPLRLTR
jgi:hypothetical protein